LWLRKLAEPTITPTGKRIPGLKLDHPRQLALMHAVVRFALNRLRRSARHSQQHCVAPTFGPRT